MESGALAQNVCSRAVCVLCLWRLPRVCGCLALPARTVQSYQPYVSPRVLRAAILGNFRARVPVSRRARKPPNISIFLFRHGTAAGPASRLPGPGYRNLASESRVAVSGLAPPARVRRPRAPTPAPPRPTAHSHSAGPVRVPPPPALPTSLMALSCSFENHSDSLCVRPPTLSF